MKIGYLTGQYPRATDTFIQREVDILRRLDLQVLTFSVRPPQSEHLIGEEQKNEFAKTFYILPTNVFVIVVTHLTLLLANISRYMSTLALAWKTCQPGLKGLAYQIFYFIESGILAKQLKKYQLKHLHAHLADTSCTVAMLASELAGINFSFTIHGPYIFYEPYRWSLSEKIKQAIFVVCISNFCRSQCMYFSDVEEWHKLHIIHCGIEPEFYSPTIHSGTGSHLLYVGRLSAAKGLPILLESLASIKETHPDLVLTIVGDGADREKLEKIVIDFEMSNHVKFVGYKNQADVRQLLQGADIFILPSFAEGVPVSLMEAMATGVPVISTRIAGISELVKEGINGYLVSPGNVNELTEKIEDLYAAPELRQSFGVSGRKYIEKHFNLLHEGKNLLNLFKSNLEY